MKRLTKFICVLCLVAMCVLALGLCTSCGGETWQDLARKEGYDVELEEVDKDSFVADEEIRANLISITKVTFRVDEDAEDAAVAYVYEFTSKEYAEKYLAEVNKPDPNAVGAGSVTIMALSSIYDNYALRGHGQVIAGIEHDCLSKATK